MLERDSKQLQEISYKIFAIETLAKGKVIHQDNLMQLNETLLHLREYTNTLPKSKQKTDLIARISALGSALGGKPYDIIMLEIDVNNLLKKIDEIALTEDQSKRLIQQAGLLYRKLNTVSSDNPGELTALSTSLDKARAILSEKIISAADNEISPESKQILQQAVNVCASGGKPLDIIKMEMEINKLLKDINENNLTTEQAKPLIHEFNRLYWKLYATSYENREVIGAMHANLDQARNILSDKLSVIKDNDLSQLWSSITEKMIKKFESVQMTPEEFSEFSRVKVLGAGHFGEAVLYACSNRNERFNDFLQGDKNAVIKEAKTDKTSKEQQTGVDASFLNEADMVGHLTSQLSKDAPSSLAGGTIIQVGSEDKIVSKTVYLDKRDRNKGSKNAKEYLKGVKAAMDFNGNGEHAASNAKRLIALIESIINGVHASQSECHQKNLIHCDTFLRNFMIEELQHTNWVLPIMIDFGVSRVMSPETGIHTAYFHDTNTISLPAAIGMESQRENATGGYLRNISIVDDLLAKKMAFMEVIMVLMSNNNINHEEYLSHGDLVALVGVEKLKYINNKWIDYRTDDFHIADIRKPIISAFFEAFRDYLTQLPAKDIGKSEIIAQDHAAFQEAYNKFELKCAELISLLDKNHANQFESAAQPVGDVESRDDDNVKKDADNYLNSDGEESDKKDADNFLNSDGEESDKKDADNFLNSDGEESDKKDADNYLNSDGEESEVANIDADQPDITRILCIPEILDLASKSNEQSEQSEKSAKRTECAQLVVADLTRLDGLIKEAKSELQISAPSPVDNAALSSTANLFQKLGMRASDLLHSNNSPVGVKESESVKTVGTTQIEQPSKDAESSAADKQQTPRLKG